VRPIFEAKVILLAKANQRQREQEASASTSLNSNKKRTLGVTPASSNSPTAPNEASGKPLERDSRLGKYFEYDLSKMVNSKGGFLLEDGQEIDDTVRRKEKERERQRAVKNLEPRKSLALCSYILALAHIYCSYVLGPGP
jgi:DNA-repair protein complementing XP-A cells